MILTHQNYVDQMFMFLAEQRHATTKLLEPIDDLPIL